MCLNLGMQTAPLQPMDLITCLKVSMCTNLCRVMTQFCIAPVNKGPTPLTLQAKILLSLRAARCIAHPSESWCVHSPTHLLRRLLVWTGQMVSLSEKCLLLICTSVQLEHLHVQDSKLQTVYPLPTQMHSHSSNIHSNFYLLVSLGGSEELGNCTSLDEGEQAA